MRQLSFRRLGLSSSGLVFFAITAMSLAAGFVNTAHADVLPGHCTNGDLGAQWSGEDGGHCYWIPTDTYATYDSAVSACHANSGYGVSIETGVENTYVHTVIYVDNSLSSTVWLGTNQTNGSYLNPSGESITWDNGYFCSMMGCPFWNVNASNYQLDSVHSCLKMVDEGPTYSWHSESCDDTHYILCEAAVNTPPPPVPDYTISGSVLVSGGGEKGRSAKYLLDDTIGEPAIGPGMSAEYGLSSGYREKLLSSASISMSCSSSVTLPVISAAGQSTGSGTCVVTTDAEDGYALSWGVFTGSGGTNTGSLISHANTIGPYTPVAAGVPEAWSVAAGRAEWGGRLRSVSTDTDAKWGTDGGSDLWLNLPVSSSSTIVSRHSPTGGGSSEIIQFRAEIGTGAFRISGTYEATVTFIVVAL